MTTAEEIFMELRFNPEDIGMLGGVLSDAILDAGATDEQAELLRRGKIPLVAVVDKQAIILFSKCRFAPGTFPKRFASNALQLSFMSPKQYRWLWDFVYSYRGQIAAMEPKDMAAKVYGVAIAIRKVRGKPVVEITNERRANKAAKIAPAFERWEGLVG